MATLKYRTKNNKQFIITALFVMWCVIVHAQTNDPITLSSPNTTGTYSSGTSVTLAPGFTSTGPFNAFIQMVDCIPLTTAASTNQNYVITNTPRITGITNADQFSGRSTCELIQTIQYTDGLGRPMQSIQVMGSPFGKDIVQPMAYDPYGREVKKYLPYVPTGTIGTYRADALTGGQTGFYQNQSDATGVVQIPAGQVAYAETLPENSPLGRPLQQGSPGLNNQINGGHTVTTSYGVNTSADAVKMWQVGAGGGASYTASYTPGTLYKTVVTDENQNNNAMITFKDKDDRVISRWVQNGASTYYITDYIYDDMGHLRYVVPPLPQTVGPAANSAVSMPASFDENNTVFQNFFYAYHYDGLNRLTEKKLPGQGWQYIVYNQMDQPVLTQDANQRAKGIWMITKYDGLGRVVMTGWFTTSSSRDVFQNAIDNVVRVQYETFTNATTNYGYDNGSYPDLTAWGTKVLSVHYFDNYDIISNTTVNPNAAIYTAPNSAIDTLDKVPRSLPVATLTNVLGTTGYLFSVMHYDDDGRAVKVTSQHYQGGTVAANKYDTEENQYSFQSMPVQSTRRNYLPAGLQVTINSWNSYDHSNRPLWTRQQYNAGTITTLSKTDYNELGQAKTKHLHSTAATASDNSSFLQHIDYRYNARGWLARINNPANLTDESSGNTDVFAERLDYDQNTTGYTAAPNYNGNISSISWQTKLPASVTLAQEQKGYAFTYDPLSRLTNAASKAAVSGNDQYNESLTYDELGNILSLNRKNGLSATLNNMSYSYMNSGVRSNKLNSIADAGTEAINTSYTYDANGNQTADTKKTVTSIVYNELNLPQTVSITTNNKTLNYVYDASGNKLQRIINVNGTVAENRTYDNGIEYTGNSIELIHTPEGRALFSTGAYILEYNVADHLGNIRAVFGDKDNNGILTANDIVQNSDYYAFGREIGYSPNLVPNPDNKYKYNGKEYQNDLAELDYGARFYDPVIGRWNVVDPLAENSRRWSPYNYVVNNPIGNIDPDGMDYTQSSGGTEQQLATLEHRVGVNNFNEGIASLMTQYRAGNGIPGGGATDNSPELNLEKGASDILQGELNEDNADNSQGKTAHFTNIELGNGNFVEVKFQDTNGGVSSDNKVSMELINAVKAAIIETNIVYSIKSITISATTNGGHESPRHPGGRAVDISAINGIAINTGKLNKLVSQLQYNYEQQKGRRENFGPAFMFKSGQSYIDVNDIKLNYRRYRARLNVEQGHTNHIHWSID
jgi:RHS repeat-associated protein